MEISPSAREPERVLNVEVNFVFVKIKCTVLSTPRYGNSTFITRDFDSSENVCHL